MYLSKCMPNITSTRNVKLYYALVEQSLEHLSIHAKFKIDIKIFLSYNPVNDVDLIISTRDNATIKIDGDDLIICTHSIDENLSHSLVIQPIHLSSLDQCIRDKLVIRAVHVDVADKMFHELNDDVIARNPCGFHLDE